MVPTINLVIFRYGHFVPTITSYEHCLWNGTPDRTVAQVGDSGERLIPV